MEVLSGPRLQLLWEDVVYAVLSIVNEDAILDHLQNCFKIPEEEFSDLKDIVVEAYKKPQIHLKLKTVKITSYPHIEDGHGIVCVVKIGENLHHTREGNVKWMWDVDKTFNLETLWDQKLEVETWQDQEKDAKANLSRVCLRSLDQISKKIRLNLRSQNLTSFYPTLPGDKSNILAIKMGDDQGNNSLNSITRDTNSVKEDPKLLQDNNDKRRDTIHVSDSNWVLNAFSSLKRSNLKKKSIPNNGTELPEDNYIDIRSPIPTGQDSLAVMQRSWSVKSERSFFSKYSSKPGYKLGSQTDKKDLDKGDIKTKPEVQVRRQLFRDFLTPTSVIPENEPCHLNSDLKIPLHEVKSMPKLHSISDFIPIALKHGSVEESNTNSLSKERKISLMKGLSSPSLKTGSLTLSAKNDFQLWKRASLSASKERKISAPACCNKEFSQEQGASILSIDKFINNNKNKGYDDHDLKEFIKNKTKIGSASVDLKELFMKMPCSSWSVEEEVDYITTTHNKIISPIKSLSKVQILLELKPRLTLSSMPAFRVFILCLKQILTIEQQLQVNEDEGMGMYLPLRKNSKLILKCLAFSYNLSEAHLSLACWLVLINGHSLDHLFNAEAKEISSSGDKEENEMKVHPGDSKESLEEEKGSNRRKSFGFCGEIHPKYFFHWLEKTESFVSSSSFDEEKEKLIFSSLENFIESFCQQLRRIHATFPISHASHLTCGLRCINLLSASECLRNIVTKYGKDFEDSWPKSNIFDAVLNHANNWINALHDEIIAKNDYKEEEENTSVSHSEETLKPAIVTKNAPLMQAIMNGEKAMLALNDFIGLGEKVYESIFKRELDESYLELIWPTIISILETVLNPIQSLLHTNQINITQDMESMQDLHMYLWILLLQLSKLQRFQISMEKQTDSIKLPESFTEAFFLLSRLWLRICLVRVEEMVDLECQADSLTTTDVEEGISSSARELTDVMHVMQEKISRFSFPPIKKFKENLALYLEDGLVPIIETYQRRICPKAVEIAAASNTLTAQMCVALNNVQKVSSEAEALINFLSPHKVEVETLQIQSLRVQTKEASFFIFSKSLPRLQTWVTNALSTKESDDFLLDWIKSVLEALFVEFAPQSKLHTILLQQFWDYVFIIMKEKQETIAQPKDFRFLGNFMEKLYYMFKVSLRVHLHSESETAFKEFMKTIQLKASLTSEVIQVYYADRLKEQITMQTNRKPLVINAYFCKNKGLKVDIYVCPSVEITNKALTSTNNKGQNSIATLSRRNLYEFGLFDWKPQNFPKDFRVASHVKKKAASVFVALTKSSAVNYYVKVHPVPGEWFKKVSSKKTKCTQKNPPVFEDQLSFNIKPTDGGVINGGFLLFRLKYSSASSSAVDSEAILPLKDIPILSSEEKLENKHTYLTMSAPSSFQDYETLQELQTRKQDKDATAFITQLEQSFWTNQSISH